MNRQISHVLDGASRKWKTTTIAILLQSTFVVRLGQVVLLDLFYRGLCWFTILGEFQFGRSL